MAASLQRKLEGWKTIAGFFDRTVRTIQRWERTQDLPIRRHLHLSQSTVYAYEHELSDWLSRRTPDAVTRRGAD